MCSLCVHEVHNVPGMLILYVTMASISLSIFISDLTQIYALPNQVNKAQFVVLVISLCVRHVITRLHVLSFTVFVVFLFWF